jgi:hypothetical protein
MTAMVVCPVCEHAQEHGDACDVCGKHLAGPGVVGAPTPPLEGLEPTLLDTPAGEPVALLTDLEPTALAPAEEPASAPLWLEPLTTAAEEPAAPPWLEPTPFELAGAVPAARPAAVCRYCRTPAGEGEVFCSRCGVMVDVLRTPDVEMADVARCLQCGKPITGPRCAACGARHRRQE